MQACVHLTLFALLFVISASATAVTSSPHTSITGSMTSMLASSGSTTPAPASPTTAPTSANSTTPAPASPTSAPTSANSTTPAPASPTSAPTSANSTTPAPASPTSAPTSANSTTPAPASPTSAPTSANSTTPAPASPTSAPTSANSTTPAPASPTSAPTSANSTTPAPASPTSAPTSANSTTPAPASPASAPTSANSTTPAPASPASAPTSASSTTPAPASPASAPTSASSTTPAPASPASAPTSASSTTPAPASPASAPANASNTTSAPTSTSPLTTTSTGPLAAGTPAAPATFIKENSPGTVPSVTSSNVSSPKTSNPNPDITSICQHDSCAGGSHCVNLNNIHFCLCIDGYYYNSSSCKKGKVFPGIIQVKTPDTSDLENEKSINYQNLYVEVSKFFKDVFANSDYGQTVIQQVSISAPARSQTRAGDKVVSVTVVNLFAEDTKENEMTISNAIHNATSQSSSITNYTNQNRCEFYGCVKENDCSDVFQCKCQAGYERPNPNSATCLPLSEKCPYACNSKPNTQCLVKDDGSPDCVCLAGYKKDDQEKCQACAFGYNGVNCEDNLSPVAPQVLVGGGTQDSHVAETSCLETYYPIEIQYFQLILIVLVPIAGVLILGMVITLVFVRSKKTKDTEEQNLIENDFQNLGLQQMTGFGSPAGGSIFPRITASFPRDGGMQNPYVNSRGTPRPDY